MAELGVGVITRPQNIVEKLMPPGNDRAPLFVLKDKSVKKYLLLSCLILPTLAAAAKEESPATKQAAKTCDYPASPINWVLAYCAWVVGTDDEIALQDSSCFKAAEPDLKKSDECQINEKYKKKVCEKKLGGKSSKDALQKCLRDPDVKPFFAGR